MDVLQSFAYFLQEGSSEDSTILVATILNVETVDL